MYFSPMVALDHSRIGTYPKLLYMSLSGTGIRLEMVLLTFLLVTKTFRKKILFPYINKSNQNSNSRGNCVNVISFAQNHAADEI